MITADWQAIAGELDADGCARTPRLLTPAVCRELAAQYERPELFRSTVDMARHRFGSGQYRYFTHDLPSTRPRAARGPLPAPAGDRPRLGLPPRPVPRGRTPWGSGWRCATRPGRVRARRSCCATWLGDWNALHRDLFGDTIFPLQVVVGLERVRQRTTPVVSSSWSSSGRGRSPGAPAVALQAGARPDLHHQGPAGRQRARLVRRLRSGTAGQHRPLRPPTGSRPRLPRRLSRGVDPPAGTVPGPVTFPERFARRVGASGEQRPQAVDVGERHNQSYGRPCGGAGRESLLGAGGVRGPPVGGRAGPDRP